MERRELGLGQRRSQREGRSGHGKGGPRLGEGFISNKVQHVCPDHSPPPQSPAPTCVPLKAHAGEGERKPHQTDGQIQRRDARLAQGHLSSSRSPICQQLIQGWHAGLLLWAGSPCSSGTQGAETWREAEVRMEDARGLRLVKKS